MTTNELISAILDRNMTQAKTIDDDESSGVLWLPYILLLTISLFLLLISFLHYHMKASRRRQDYNRKLRIAITQTMDFLHIPRNSILPVENVPKMQRLSMMYTKVDVNKILAEIRNTYHMRRIEKDLSDYESSGESEMDPEELEDWQKFVLTKSSTPSLVGISQKPGISFLDNLPLPGQPVRVHSETSVTSKRDDTVDKSANPSASCTDLGKLNERARIEPKTIQPKHHTHHVHTRCESMFHSTCANTIAWEENELQRGIRRQDEDGFHFTFSSHHMVQLSSNSSTSSNVTSSQNHHARHHMGLFSTYLGRKKENL